MISFTTVSERLSRGEKVFDVMVDVILYNFESTTQVKSLFKMLWNMDEDEALRIGVKYNDLNTDIYTPLGHILALYTLDIHDREDSIYYLALKERM